MSVEVEVEIRNRQRTWRVEVDRLRALTEGLLERELGLSAACLGIHLIGATAMASMNWQWLKHEGSTDILTFDHRSESGEALHGELFISVDDAVAQSAQFRTTADAELVRYVVHGVLHLLGHNDLEPEARRSMKREENRLVRRLAAGFDFEGLVSRAKRERVKEKGRRGSAGRVAVGKPRGRRMS
jgi:probable rRNA maturation factor